MERDGKQRDLSIYLVVVGLVGEAEMSAVLEINEETAEVLTNRAKAEGQSVDEYVKSLLSQNEKPIAPQKTSDAEFEADMEAFAEGTEHLQPYAGTYSRADIYFDHD